MNKKVAESRRRALTTATFNSNGAMSAFPPQMRGKFTYLSGAVLAKSNAQFSNYHQYRLTSPFDPDYTNATKNTRSTGFYEISHYYKRYRILSCEVEITFVNLTNAMSVVAGMTHTNDASMSTGLLASNLASRPFALSAVVTPSGTSHDTRTIRRRYTSKEMYGVNDSWMWRVHTEMTTEASPSYLNLLNVFIGQIDDASTSECNVQYQISLTYDVEMSDLLESAFDSV